MEADSVERRQEELGIHILENIRNELYYYFPYLDGAFACISGKGSEQTGTIGTDGAFFLFSPEYLLKLYVKKPEAVRRGYLHMLLHCLYLHLFREDQEDRRLWNLACDIAVEQIISREKIPILETGGDAKKIREKVFHILGDRSDSAEKICRKLKEQTFPFHLEELEEAFHFDDHTLWDTCTGEKGKRTKEKWNKLLSYTAANRQDHRKRRGCQKGDQKEEAGTVRSGRYDYKKFLRQFSVLREEVELDTESFDYIFYNYGMELYGNMPLIEPLETKEEQRVEDFVIVIDTSMSCKGELVRAFLDQTYAVLSESESFFRKLHIHIIQCDDRVQEDVVIRNHEEMEDYLQHFTVKGFGGTDFRPAFLYVQELLAKKTFTKLRGLIYFTDGYGTFPMKKPPYDTAFVFMKEDYRDVDVPPWAMKLILEKEELMDCIEREKTESL